jgi:hypothetical protein
MLRTLVVVGMKKSLCSRMAAEASAAERIARDILAWDPNEETRGELAELLERGDRESIEKLFSGRLEFGTAGLRGRMGLGTVRMNDVVVIQSSQVRATCATCAECVRQRGR